MPPRSVARTMRAIVVSEFGPPEVLVPTDVPDPVAADGQVVVDVELALITFVETQIRAGRPPVAAMAPALPYTPGNGVAASIGDRRVIAQLGGRGGYAERAVVAEEALIDVPIGVSLPDALALLADGRTAGMLMEQAAIAPGETVLVPAAAGGVGLLLTQLARAAGARVIAAAGGERKVALARENGADVAVDYTRDDWAGDLGPVDVAFDGVGGAIGRTAFGLTRPGGRYLPFGAASGAFAGITPEEAEQRRVAIVRLGPPSPQDARRLVEAALDAAGPGGALRPLVGQQFPLEDAAAAHRAIETRATAGKTLLDVR
jgi:NADPH:quinone reductase